MNDLDFWTPDADAPNETGVGVTAAQGFRAAGVAAGLKKSGGLDVALVLNDGPLDVAAAVTTSNRIVAAPVVWTRVAVSDGRARAVVLNSGGANACTGEEGYADAVATASGAAMFLNSASAGAQVTTDDVLVCSTGLIGERLPMEQLLSGVQTAAAMLQTGAAAGGFAAQAIMTTDTVPKTTAQAGEGWTVGGMAKGAGMLAPGLATMLCVLTTDAVISAATADEALHAACAQTFDRLDSDGCMSTNDTVILLASGASGVHPAEAEFTERLIAACADLARQLIADAEGASHDIKITVTGATSQDAALAVARAVARSNLFKAAMFGNDPNWGRILAAMGTVPAEVAPFDPNAIDVSINRHPVCRAGVGFQPARWSMTNLAKKREVLVDIDLHAGEDSVAIWTNDLTHDYVHENSAYSS